MLSLRSDASALHRPTVELITLRSSTKRIPLSLDNCVVTRFVLATFITLQQSALSQTLLNILFVFLSID